MSLTFSLGNVIFVGIYRERLALDKTSARDHGVVGTSCLTTTTLTLRSTPQWCGDSEGENTDLKKRLMDFLKSKWGNPGFTSMMPSIVIDPDFELGNPEHEVGTIATTQTFVFVQASSA